MKTNWQTKKLGDVCEIVKDVPREYVGVKKYFSTGAINNSNFYFSKEVTYNGKPSRANSYPKIGDVGFAKMKFTNKILLINDDLNGSIFSTGFCFLRPNKLLDSRYLFHFIISDEFQKLKDLYAGDGIMGGIKNADVKKIKISLPPLSKQKRIVKILDEVFKKTTKVKGNAEKNLQNTKDLFDSYLKDVFANQKEDWEEKRFNEICVLQRGFDLPTHLRNKGKFPLVSSNGITDKINLWKVKSPGVVTGRSGTIGNVHFIEKDYWPLNTTLYIKEFYGNYERFVYYFLKQFNLGKYSSGAGVPTLNRNNVHSERVWFLKSLSKQKSIVKKLDKLSAQTKKLEEIYKKKLLDLEELKKSVLKRAFSGEL